MRFRSCYIPCLTIWNDLRQSTYICHQHRPPEMVGDLCDPALGGASVRLSHDISRTEIGLYQFLRNVMVVQQDTVFELKVIDNGMIWLGIFLKLSRHHQLYSSGRHPFVGHSPQ